MIKKFVLSIREMCRKGFSVFRPIKASSSLDEIVDYVNKKYPYEQKLLPSSEEHKRGIIVKYLYTINRTHNQKTQFVLTIQQINLNEDYEEDKNNETEKDAE